MSKGGAGHTGAETPRRRLGNRKALHVWLWSRIQANGGDYVQDNNETHDDRPGRDAGSQG